MKNAAVVGGSNGIGLAVTMSLKGYDRIYIVDRQEPDMEHLRQAMNNTPDTCFEYIQVDLLNEEYSLVSTIGPLRIIRHFYDRLASDQQDFYCAVMVSGSSRRRSFQSYALKTLC